MNINAVQNYNQNGISFGDLGIKIKGKMFNKHPDSRAVIMNAIRSNADITEFFKTHSGNIVVESQTATLPVKFDYPICIRKAPSSAVVWPFDQFTVNQSIPVIKMECTYNRPHTSEKPFHRKPVWINLGTAEREGMSWKECVEHALDLIRMLGKDTEEDMIRRGDTILRDLFSVEARRLEIEGC